MLAVETKATRAPAFVFLVWPLPGAGELCPGSPELPALRRLGLHLAAQSSQFPAHLLAPPHRGRQRRGQAPLPQLAALRRLAGRLQLAHGGGGLLRQADVVGGGRRQLALHAAQHRLQGRLLLQEKAVLSQHQPQVPAAAALACRLNRAICSRRMPSRSSTAAGILAAGL